MSENELAMPQEYLEKSILGRGHGKCQGREEGEGTASSGCPGRPTSWSTGRDRLERWEKRAVVRVCGDSAQAGAGASKGVWGQPNGKACLRRV